jgi:hypothetical protein
MDFLVRVSGLISDNYSCRSRCLSYGCYHNQNPYIGQHLRGRPPPWGRMCLASVDFLVARPSLRLRSGQAWPCFHGLRSPCHVRKLLIKSMQPDPNRMGRETCPSYGSSLVSRILCLRVFVAKKSAFFFTLLLTCVRRYVKIPACLSEDKRAEFIVRSS